MICERPSKTSFPEIPMHPESLHPSGAAIVNNPEIVERNQVLVDLYAKGVAVRVDEPFVKCEGEIVITTPRKPGYLHHVIAI
jgi:hypothetical protein